ncbi:MAG: glycosyltransferase family 2 protein [Clostridiales bacterium]|nr:glycosyltransferase family 2 protein [Clostridiales bacterium]
MPTMSLCMIVRNEEDVLGRCLACMKEIADEIIIVDTGSIDKTKEIAAAYTDKIYDFIWIDDFAAARNFSFSKAVMDYIMWLDADDYIDIENQHKLLALKNSLDQKTDVVMMPYHVAFDQNDTPTFSYYRERLLKRSQQFVWNGAVHEAITPQGVIVYSEVAVRHKKCKVNDPNRNLKIFQKLLQEGKALDTRQKYYYARELYYHQQYSEAIDAFQDFFASPDRWIENSIGACLDLARCYEQLGEKDKALRSLFESFLYDRPRAEICCEIGFVKMQKKQYEQAIFWYECALDCGENAQNGGFSSIDCFGFIPYMQLCVCYDQLGEYTKACECNEKAGERKPDNENYLANKRYFQNKLREIANKEEV